MKGGRPTLDLCHGENRRQTHRARVLRARAGARGHGLRGNRRPLAAVTCAFLAELLPERAQIAPAALYCVLACVLPAGSVFTAPAAYDLARVSPAASLAAAAPAAVALLTGAIDPGAGACGLLACAIAVALSLRTESTLRARNQTLLRADELRERELALEAKKPGTPGRPGLRGAPRHARRARPHRPRDP